MGLPEKRTKKSRSRLGRGLSSLVEPTRIGPIEVLPELTHKQIANIIDRVDPVQAPARSGSAPGPASNGGSDAGNVSSGDRVYEIELSAVVPNPHQPRRVFSPESLNELAQSIVEHGLMQPIVVRKGSEGGFELIAGERRWRACGIAGLRTIRAIVTDANDVDSAMLALIENIQREDLNAVERARGFASLAEGFSMTQEQIASRMGISRSTVTNLLRLLELDERTLGQIASGTLSAGHGKALLSCKDGGLRQGLGERAVEFGWSVRRLERAVLEHEPLDRRPGGGGGGGGDGGGALASGVGVDERGSRVGSILHDLENQLGEHLSTKVHLKTDRSGTKGRIIIEFYDLDHFDGLMGRLGMPSKDDLGGGK